MKQDEMKQNLHFIVWTLDILGWNVLEYVSDISLFSFWSTKLNFSLILT